jgi:hypothetical protein
VSEGAPIAFSGLAVCAGSSYPLSQTSQSLVARNVNGWNHNENSWRHERF